MSDTSKITAGHLRRQAMIYVRQSTPGQVEANRESTARQYDLTDRAVALGWSAAAVRVIDDDLGVSGSSTAGRTGFAELAAQVGRGRHRALVGVFAAGQKQRRLVSGLPPRERTPRDQAARASVWARSQACGASMFSAE
jgi:hypothetical protein